MPDGIGESLQRRMDDLLPLVRAWQLESCQLYWIPVQSTPIPFRQRQWLLEFLGRFERLAASFDILPQTFLQMKVIQPDLRDEFVRSSRDLVPLLGLSRRPGEAPPAVPDMTYADDLAKGRVKYEPEKLQPDYAYWFTGGAPEVVLSKFFGNGGMTVVYLAPDPSGPVPKLKIPARAHKNPDLVPLLGPEHLDRVNRVAAAMKSKFLPDSKEAFGKDLAADVRFAGIPFVLPLLSAASFFAAKPEELSSWFSIFPIYVQESPRDEGILLATRDDVEKPLIELLREMRDGGAEYPG